MQAHDFRPSYNDSQLSTFLSRLSPPISLPDLKSQFQNDPLAALSLLQRRTMAFCPWGSLGLHYSPHRRLPLDSDNLFHKIVERKLGGYCMENNAFFSSVLRSLGVELYITGARIGLGLDDSDPNRSQEEKDHRKQQFGGWQHEVIIATLDGEKYLVDIGLGSQGALSPLHIQPNATAPGAPGITQRLVHRTIPQFTSHTPIQPLWVVEFHHTSSSSPSHTSPDAPWTPAYCFSTQEWLPNDFDIINYRTSTDPESWFTFVFVLTKPLFEDDGDTPTGTLTMLGDELTRRMGENGKKEVLVKCKHEDDRVKALKDWFGIELTEDEKKGIRESRARIVGEDEETGWMAA